MPRRTRSGPAALFALLGATLGLAQPSSAQTQLDAREQMHLASINLDVARTYIGAYLSLDFERAAEFYTDETVLEDPAYGMRIAGKDSLLATLPGAWAGVEIPELSVRSQYGTFGGYVITTVVASGTMTGNGQTINVARVPITIVLKLEEGRVVLHQDFPDYACANAQILAQADGPVPPDALPDCDALPSTH